jgi:Family of unknown function (DUF6600)
MTLKREIAARSLLILSVIFFTRCATTYAPAPQVSTELTYQDFYNDLSPYGTWMNYPEYGNVWSPGVEGDFRPYGTNGHWVLSAEGWAWLSDYSWGWAPFHYGRWFYDDLYGWLWVPGYFWAPAWVTWGDVDGYYCWAPITPDIDITRHFNDYRPNSFYWNAVPREHIYDANLSGEIVPANNVSSFVNRISIVDNFRATRRGNNFYSRGPAQEEVQKYVPAKIEQYSFKDVNNRGNAVRNGNTINVYRPQVQDPKVTRQQHPQQDLQPAEYRQVQPSVAKPIIKENQRPAVQRSEQRVNIQRLPVQHAPTPTPERNGGRNSRN